MNVEFQGHEQLCQSGAHATHPLARLAERLPLSFLLAGMSLPRCHFVADTHPDAPSGASNCGF